jgi:cytochrome c
MLGLSLDLHDDNPSRLAVSRLRRGTTRFAAAWLAGVVTIAAPAHARTAAEAQALVERGVAHIHDVGRQQAFVDFDRPDGGFVDGELYVFCLDANGVTVANGGNPHIVGHNTSDVHGEDGRRMTVEIGQLGFTRGSGWLEYRWPNPATKRIELKVVYVLKVDDQTVCASGYYKSAAP